MPAALASVTAPKCFAVNVSYSALAAPNYRLSIGVSATNSMLDTLAVIAQPSDDGTTCAVGQYIITTRDIGGINPVRIQA